MHGSRGWRKGQGRTFSGGNIVRGQKKGERFKGEKKAVKTVLPLDK